MGASRIPRRVPVSGMDYDNSVPMMGYVGIRKEGLAQGFRISLENELGFLGFDLESQEIKKLIESCDSLIRRFLIQTWKIWSSVKKAEFAEVTAERMKQDNKGIISFVEQTVKYLLDQEDQETDCLYDFVYQPARADGTSDHEGEGICAKCPRYIARKFYLCPVELLEQMAVEINFFQVSHKPYTYLWKASIMLYHLVQNRLSEIREAAEEEGEQYTVDITLFNNLLMLPASIGKVYEMTNPVGDLLDDLAQSKISQLETPEQSHSDAEWDYFNQIFDEVWADIEDPNGPRYVKSWRNALRYRDIRKYEEKDYFFSPKSSPYKMGTRRFLTYMKHGKLKKVRKQSSYFMSLVETDPIKDDPATIAFDELIGYKSHYNTHIDPEIQIKGDWSTYSYVTNKGKRKLRGIRMIANAVQDRLQYIERVNAKWSDKISYGCRRNQAKGYVLGRQATRTWWNYKSGLLDKKEECPSLYNTDFTDATDTVSQKQLHKLNKTVYNDVIADFWDMVCKKKFTFKFPGSRETRECTPKVGNPQGGKNSFLDFDDLHKFLMLMMFAILQHLKDRNRELFKYTIHYKNTPVELACAVLGDDNGFWSIKADPLINEDIFPFFDENMGHAGAMYQVYCWLCKMCNWYLNPDKAQITTPDSDQAIWEFAKVTVIDGNTVTAPPFRMIGYMALDRVSHPIVKPLAFALWRMKTLQNNAKDYALYVIKKYTESDEEYDFFYRLLFGGYMPSLADYNDPEIPKDDETHALLLLSLIRSELKVGLISQVLSESEADLVEQFELSNLLWNGFDESLYNSLEDKEHKFNLILDKHLALADLAREVFKSSNIEDKLLQTISAVSAMRGSYSDEIDQSFNLILQAIEKGQYIAEGLVDKQGLVDDVCHINYNQIRTLQDFLAGLITQGTDKRPSVESTIGVEAWIEFQALRLAWSADALQIPN